MVKRALRIKIDLHALRSRKPVEYLKVGLFLIYYYFSV